MSTNVINNRTSAAPNGQRTVSEKGSDLSGLYIFLAFLVPFSFMFIAFAVAKVSPFGNNQILVTDLWHQYYPFLVDFQDKLKHGGSLLWTWKSGGGTNYLALMAYYLASPLNFLSVFVPAQYLREFLYVITCVKIGLAGMFFSLFLKLTFKRRDISIAAFGVMYALCAFIMGYYWNIIWLDTIALLPLVIAGTFALLRYGRFRLYVITLALSILANYYIGLFTCVFVLLVSIGYTIVEFKGLKDTLIKFVRMAVCSVIGIMISAVLTLPAYFALGHTQSTGNAFPTGFSINIGSTADFGGVLEGIGKTISNSVAFVEPTAKEGLPNIYCGVFTIFFALLFFFCSKIKARERIVCGSMLFFFMISFIIRQLDYVWHGFHFPNMLPHRFSFLYSFVLIYMAFRVFMHIDSIRPVSVISAICCFAVYLGVASKYYTSGGATLSALFTSSDPEASPVDPVALSAFFGALPAAWVLLYSFRERLSRIMTAILSAVIGIASAVFVIIEADAFYAPFRQNDPEADSTGFTVIMIVVMLLITVAIFCALASKSMNPESKTVQAAYGSVPMGRLILENRTLKGIIAFILFAVALVEGVFSSAIGVKTVSVTDGSYYPLGTTDTLSMVDKIKALEKDNTDLYRAEVNKYYSLNDNALIGVNGISMFNSMVNSRTTDFMEKFGLCGWIASNRFTYQESSPFTNMMLNLKYIIAPYGAYLDKTHNVELARSGSVNLMQNQYYLPQGFMVDDDLLSYNIANLSATEPIDNQNEFFRLATGLDGNIYEELEPTELTGSGGATLTLTSSGRYTYNSDSSSGTYDISCTAPRDGIAVAYYETYYSDNVACKVNDSEAISYYAKRPFIMMIGNVSAGDKVTCSTSVSDSSTGTINCRIAMFNEDLFLKAREKFSRSTLRASEVTDDTIRGNIDVAEDGLFYTSISYVEGWQAFVDGEEVEITPVGDALLAFKLSKGAHIIELRYTPEGFKVGLIATLLGILLFAALIILTWRKMNVFGLFSLSETQENPNVVEHLDPAYTGDPAGNDPAAQPAVGASPPEQKE